ncbi:MAG: FG-GAP repeat protein [Terriglobales bacterium]
MALGCRPRSGISTKPGVHPRFAGVRNAKTVVDFNSGLECNLGSVRSGPRCSRHRQQLAELTPSARAQNDWFGISIAMSGNTVVVGDFDANIEEYGTVDVFVKPAGG